MTYKYLCKPDLLLGQLYCSKQCKEKFFTKSLQQRYQNTQQQCRNTLQLHFLPC